MAWSSLCLVVLTQDRKKYYSATDTNGAGGSLNVNFWLVIFTVTQDAYRDRLSPLVKGIKINDNEPQGEATNPTLMASYYIDAAFF